jgi:cytochrome c oxidase subunit 2
MSNVSNFVGGVDTAFAVILGISLFFLIGITIVMIYFVVKYNRKRHPKSKNVKEKASIEIIWTVVPTILVLVMFYYGWAGYKSMRDFPDDAIHIKATGRMWSWSFEYDNGKVSPRLIVPKDEAIVLNLFSQDVLHSLYIPAFRIKEDVVPGINNKMWFEVYEEGEYDILCAEYCGERHSYMLSKVEVVSREKYEEWYGEDLSGLSSVETGLQVLTANGCIACHSLDGTRLVGPSFKGLYGAERSVIMPDGSKKTVIADEDYLKRSVYEPNAEVVETYPKVMISYKNSISEEQIDQINAYLESIK